MLHGLVSPLPPWIFVAGKGGVGKTTIAASLAVSLADSGEPTLVLSTDPAHSLGDALGQRLSAEAAPVNGVPGLAALEVDPVRERQSFMREHGSLLTELLDRGTYLDRPEVDELLELPVPGIDELGSLWRLIGLSSVSDRLVVDTAPTGHTLRMIRALDVTERWLAVLHERDDRHAIIATTLGGGSTEDASRARLEGLRSELGRLRQRMRDRGHTGFLLVTQPEPVIEAETVRYLEALEGLGIGVIGVVVNQAEPGAAGIRFARAGLPLAYVPAVSPDPTGIVRLRALAGRAAPEVSEPVADAEVAGDRVHVAEDAYCPPLDRELYLVVGKGGVGKTTVASAIAVLLSRTTRGEVLLMSTDPAGSLGDVWGVEVRGAPVAAPAEARLILRQLDAGAVWADFVERVRQRLATEPPAAGGLVGLLDLAPPGIDELTGLLEMMELLEDDRYDAVILDTAPTGHLLRLLQTPELVLEWTHAMMRLLLRYRDALGLGSVAEEILMIARRVRWLRDRLRSAERRFVAVVARPDALNLAELRRLEVALGNHGIPPDLLLVNRLDAKVADRGEAGGDVLVSMLRQTTTAAVAVAPERGVGPTGANALADFAASWRPVRGAGA